MDKPYAPSFVLNVLTATVASVVDKKLVMEKAKAMTPTADYKYDTDFGNEFLKTGYAVPARTRSLVGRPTKPSSLKPTRTTTAKSRS